MKTSFREFLSESNTQRIITLNDYSDVTKDVKDRIISNDLDVLQINYDCNPSSPSPFTEMNSLTEIKFEIKLGGNVQSLFKFFYKCESLKTVPLFDTKKVTVMRYMFAYCNSLKSVPLFDTKKVKDMSDMFYKCNSLKTVPLFDTKNVTDMSSMFAFCDSLESVPLFDAKKVKDTRYMFYKCDKLESVPSFDTKKRNKYGFYAFQM